MRSKRKREHSRFIRRLETEFSAEGKNYRGISSDLSINGLFIRTNHAFAPGSIIDLTIHLPGGATSKLKGKVMRALKTPIVSLKNGMGIKLIEKDSHYINFMKSYSPDNQEKTTESTSSDFLIISCSKCGVKNKVHKSKTSLGPKCGKCGFSLIINLA